MAKEVIASENSAPLPKSDPPSSDERRPRILAGGAPKRFGSIRRSLTFIIDKDDSAADHTGMQDDGHPSQPPKPAPSGRQSAVPEATVLQSASGTEGGHEVRVDAFSPNPDTAPGAERQTEGTPRRRLGRRQMSLTVERPTLAKTRATKSSREKGDTTETPQQPESEAAPTSPPQPRREGEETTSGQDSAATVVQLETPRATVPKTDLVELQKSPPVPAPRRRQVLSEQDGKQDTALGERNELAGSGGFRFQTGKEFSERGFHSQNKETVAAKDNMKHVASARPTLKRQRTLGHDNLIDVCALDTGGALQEGHISQTQVQLSPTKEHVDTSDSEMQTNSPSEILVVAEVHAEEIPLGNGPEAEVTPEVNAESSQTVEYEPYIVPGDEVRTDDHLQDTSPEEHKPPLGSPSETPQTPEMRQQRPYRIKNSLQGWCAAVNVETSFADAEGETKNLMEEEKQKRTRETFQKVATKIKRRLSPATRDRLQELIKRKLEEPDYAPVGDRELLEKELQNTSAALSEFYITPAGSDEVIEKYHIMLDRARTFIENDVEPKQS